jgi:hypothetical protein
MMGLKERLEAFENTGYDFYLDWTEDKPIVPERVQLPSGRILDRNELEKDNSNEARQGLIFLKLVDSLYVDSRCKRYPYSFRDNQDVEKMKSKYYSAI